MHTHLHALEALLWSAGEEFDGRDASPELVSRVEQDWLAFEALLPASFDPDEAYLGRMPSDGAWQQVAHDWILTRNHHGVGFWEQEWDLPWREVLTAMAHRQGELEVYVGDDGNVHY